VGINCHKKCAEMSNESLSPLYSPLNPTNSEIRLMHLISPPGSEEISCTLATLGLVSAKRPSVYEALSYAWGSANDLRVIRADGHEVQVRQNLYEFLQVYQKREDNGWI
jgi:hypothetical protein